jgi:hypothetical protein
MKNPFATALIILGTIALASCSNESSTWTQDQKDTWLKDCNDKFVANADPEDKANLESLCTCMLEVTARDYTPEEAKSISEDEERKLLENCNYNW